MHVLMLPSWYSTVDKPWRGVFVRDQAAALLRAGVRVGVAFVERRSLSQFNTRSVLASHFQLTRGEEDGIATIRMKGWSTFAQTVPGSLLWCRLTRRLAEAYARSYGVPDLIHGHAALWGGYAAKLAATMFGCPYVITEHSSTILTQNLSRAGRGYASATYRGAAGVISVSHKLKESVDAVAGRAVATVVPNTVDADYFVPRQRTAAHPFTFLAVCDLVGYKRVDLLLRAFARVRRRSAACRLVIVGGGKADASVRSLAGALGLESAVRFTGPLPRWSVREWMQEASALVLASTHETFGVVLIEAMASGLPVLATSSGGPDEIVTPDTGILVPPGDEEAFAEAMRVLLARRFDASRIREIAVRRFGYPVVAEALRQSYEIAIANAGGRSVATRERARLHEHGGFVISALEESAAASAIVEQAGIGAVARSTFPCEALSNEDTGMHL